MAERYQRWDPPSDARDDSGKHYWDQKKSKVPHSRMPNVYKGPLEEKKPDDSAPVQQNKSLRAELEEQMDKAGYLRNA